jgi:hypothetical protein
MTLLEVMTRKAKRRVRLKVFMIGLPVDLGGVRRGGGAPAAVC